MEDINLIYDFFVFIFVRKTIPIHVFYIDNDKKLYFYSEKLKNNLKFFVAPSKKMIVDLSQLENEEINLLLNSIKNYRDEYNDFIPPIPKQSFQNEIIYFENILISLARLEITFKNMYVFSEEKYSEIRKECIIAIENINSTNTTKDFITNIQNMIENFSRAFPDSINKFIKSIKKSFGEDNIKNFYESLYSSKSDMTPNVNDISKKLTDLRNELAHTSRIVDIDDIELISMHNLVIFFHYLALVQFNFKDTSRTKIGLIIIATIKTNLYLT